LVTDLLGARIASDVQQARLQTPATLRIAHLHVQRERFHQHGAVREAPAWQRPWRGLRIGDRFVLDLRFAWQSDVTLLDRAIGPQLGVDGVWDQAWRGLQLLRRGEQASLAQLARELRRTGISRRGLDELVNPAADEVQRVDFAGIVLAPGHDAN